MNKTGKTRYTGMPELEIIQPDFQSICSTTTKTHFRVQILHKVIFQWYGVILTQD